MVPMKSLRLFVTSCLLAIAAPARVGETEEQLAHRYGTVKSRQLARKSSQGRVYTYGEYLNFHSDDWKVRALLINGRCEEINYSKLGEWTDIQFRHLLEINGGRAQWAEVQSRNPKLRREWRRHDKTSAQWGIAGFNIKTPVADQAREAVEKAAKEEASKLPKF